MKLISQLTLAGLLSVITTNSIAADPSSANYRMRWDVLDSGGGVSASTNYQMTGSIQSTAIGQSSSTNYKMTAGFQSVPDTDADSVRDFLDNCTLVANTNQTNADSDLDIFGNACDADLNNDGFVTVVDYLILRSRLNTADAVADLNDDGFVTVVDYLILRSKLNQQPGPSGLPGS